jgi:phosphoketolase
LGQSADTAQERTETCTSAHKVRNRVRGQKEQGNINTPLELAIRNRTDRFSLAACLNIRERRLR